MSTPVERFAARLPVERRRRLLAIHAAVRHAGGDGSVRVRNGKLVFENNERSIALASYARHLSVFLPAPLLAGIRLRHPELDCGAACVRIRDTQHVPMFELRAAFRAIFGADADA